MKALSRKYRKNGLVVLGVTSEPNSRSVREYGRRAFGYPVLPNARRVVEQYGARSNPYTVLIDRNGMLVSRRVGFRAGDEKALEAEVRRLLRKT